MPANLHIQEEEDQRVDPENQGARNFVKEDTVRVLSKIVKVREVGESRSKCICVLLRTGSTCNEDKKERQQYNLLFVSQSTK